jgi:scyllo-inositol 2-dehydrogenase (NADP+)
MIHAGIVGYGYAGRSFHAYLVSLAEGLKLAAIATRDPARREAAAREQGVATYATLAEMLADERIGLVIIATPHDTHASLAIQAMDAGRHVVVDKVMCLCAAEADGMIAASERNRVMLSVFHNRRWDWDFLTVKKAIADGLLGEPFLIETAVFRYRPSRNWRASKARSGGLLYDWGAHLIDQALQLVPSRPASVFCDTQKRLWEGDTEDHVKCLIRFENGLLYTAEVSNLGRIGKPRWLVLGTLGALVKEGLDPQEGPMVRGNIDAAEEPPAHRARLATELNGMPADITLESVRGSWKSYYQNIADVLNHGAELAVKPAEVRTLMAVLDAAKTSVETGAAVPVEDST